MQVKVQVKPRYHFCSGVIYLPCVSVFRRPFNVHWSVRIGVVISFLVNDHHIGIIKARFVVLCPALWQLIEDLPDQLPAVPSAGS